MTRKNTQKLNGENSDVESLTPEQLQHISSVGIQAAELLGSPVFNVAYQNLMNKKYQEWLVSQPKESQKRESLYHQAAGLISIAEELHGAVEDARRIEQAQAERNSSTRAEQNYMDQQGFGLNLN